MRLTVSSRRCGIRRGTRGLQRHAPRSVQVPPSQRNTRPQYEVSKVSNIPGLVMRTFYDRFLECVERWPNNVALEIQRPEGVERYTYAEVRRIAESIARWITGNGFEYYRHGTLSLYAALDVKTGKVQGKTAKRHTSAEFIVFLRELVKKARWAKQIHIVLDNLSAHKTKAVEEFLEQNPKVRFHFTPTYSSWLNQVELWFAKIQRDVITRGVFTSVA